MAVITWIATPAAGSQTPTPDALAESHRLRDAGDFAAAAQLLRAQLAQQPNNGDVARLLAQTLYWLQDLEGARAVYDAALVRHPQDTALRLQYGRMLAETGQRARARELVTPLQAMPTPQAEASALLGTLAYWEGDLTTAQRLFEAALRANPALAEARRQLQEILSVSAPWIRVSSGLGHDDQPLDRVAVGVEAGWFATPLMPVTVRVEPRRYRLGDSTTRRLWDGEVAVAHFAPALRLETELAGGVVQRSDRVEALDWKGRGALGVRLPQHLTLRVRAERTPYLYTTASLDTPVVVHTATGLLHWQDPRGWLGEAAYQQQRYPDDNMIRTAYAWQLAPLVYQRTAELQVGYAFAAEHADESRFVLALPAQPYPPGNPRFSTTGRYEPYYTPSHVVTHSAIAAVTVRPFGSTTLRLGGAYAFRATEDASAFVVSANQVQRSVTSRAFSTWNARSAIEIALGDGATLSATGELGRTAFYQWSAAGLQVTYRFGATP